MMFVYLTLLILFLAAAVGVVWHLSKPRRPSPLPELRAPVLRRGTSQRSMSSGYPADNAVPQVEVEILGDQRPESLIPANRTTDEFVDRDLIQLRGEQTGPWNFRTEQKRIENARTLLKSKMKLQMEIVEGVGDIEITKLDKDIAIESRRHMKAALRDLASLELEFQKAQTTLAISTLRLKQQEIFDRIDRLAATGRRATDGMPKARPDDNPVIRNGVQQ